MKPRILFLTEYSRLSTGYAIYSNEIISRLYNSGRYEIAELAAYISEDKLGEYPRQPWPVFPNMPNQGDKEAWQVYNSEVANQFCKYRFEEVCLEFKPDFVWSCSDPWMNMWLDFSPFRHLFHQLWLVPADSISLDPEWLDIWETVDSIFTYNDWSKQTIENESGGRVRVISSAPPAASSLLVPLDKNKVKEQCGLQDKLIIGSVMRNQRRKLFNDLFICFRELLNQTKRNDILLYCQTSYPDLGWQLGRLINEQGLSSKILLSYVCRNCKNFHPAYFSDAVKLCPFCNQLSCSPANAQHGLTDAQMNHVYNLFDLYIQYHNCEGFGIPQIEAAATACHVMAVDYSAPEDVVRKLNGTPLKVLDLYREPDTHRYFAMPDNKDCIEKLKWFVNLPSQMRNILGFKTYQGYKDNYNWDKTAKKWMNRIDSIDHNIYRKRWSQKQIIRSIPNQLPQCSNSDFVNLLLGDILGRHDLIGRYFANKMLQNLNFGTCSGNLFSRCSDDVSIFGRPQRFELTREMLFNQIANMVQKNNYWLNRLNQQNEQT